MNQLNKLYRMNYLFHQKIQYIQLQLQVQKINVKTDQLINQKPKLILVNIGAI